MKSNSKKTGLVFQEVEVLQQIKKPAENSRIKDYGFGFYYPNAVAVNKKMLELVRREIEPNSDQCNIERVA